MRLCTWCEKRIWPWEQRASSGMHKACARHWGQLLTAEHKRQTQHEDWRKRQYEGRDD